MMLNIFFFYQYSRVFVRIGPSCFPFFFFYFAYELIQILPEIYIYVMRTVIVAGNRLEQFQIVLFITTL